MSEKKRIFVFGAGGHAKVVIDIIERQGLYGVCGLVDDEAASRGSAVYGYTVLGGKEELLHRRLTDTLDTGIVAIGDNRARLAAAAWMRKNGFHLATAIHPSAQLSRGVTVGAGTVIMAGAVINSGSRIGNNVIINTRAGVDHDCCLEDGVHIAPGATLCGSVAVGARTFICAGVTVIQNLTIGADAVVGAGATVIRDLPDGVTVAGNPARQIKEISP